METFYVQTNTGDGFWRTEAKFYNQAEAREKASFYRNQANGEYATRIRRTREAVM